MGVLLQGGHVLRASGGKRRGSRHLSCRSGSTLPRSCAPRRRTWYLGDCSAAIAKWRFCVTTSFPGGGIGDIVRVVNVRGEGTKGLVDGGADEFGVGRETQSGGRARGRGHLAGQGRGHREE